MSSMLHFWKRNVHNWILTDQDQNFSQEMRRHTVAVMLSLSLYIYCHKLILVLCLTQLVHWTGPVLIWASKQENLSSEVCEQHRRIPACASAQTGQRLCYSLFGKYHIYKTCYKQKFNFLASLCSWGVWFESHFVETPEDRFSREEAHMYLFCRQACSQKEFATQAHSPRNTGPAL